MCALKVFRDLLIVLAVAIISLGVIPNHGQPPPTEPSIAIHLHSNGVHTDLILPIKAFDVDWRERLSLDSIMGGDTSLDHVAVGWGDREFYLNTRDWGDLKLTTAVKALLGLDSTVIHVTAVDLEQFVSPPRSLRVSKAQYERLTAHLLNQFRRSPEGKLIPIASAHYGTNDLFFDATGHYSMVVTCNEWVRQALDDAGLRVPLWTPFHLTLMHPVFGSD